MKERCINAFEIIKKDKNNRNHIPRADRISVIFFQKMYEVTDGGYPMDKKRNQRRNEMRIYFDADNKYR